MQGQGESQPGEGVESLDSLANQMEPSETPDESEGGDAPEESELPEVEGDEPDEQPEEGEEEATVTIKHDGKDVTLKQSEVIELAQKGFDYTNKAMAVAEQRKALEPIKAQVETLRQQNESALTESQGRLTAIVSFMQEQLGDPPPVEWASQDAGYYIAQKELYESRKGQLEKAQQALHRVEQERNLSRQSAIQQQILETQAALKDTLPDWNTAKEEELAAYVGEQGLNPKDADMAFWKSGFWTMAHKAKAYDGLMAEKAKMKPVSTLAKVIKPSTNNQPPQLAKRQDAMKRHNANPSLNTLADLI
ncbi:MAG: hypothetical protein A3E01_06990 [Gammaproteobacteria bacterium RIFCSPHIGHO2_12_FULL_63_22]|nr:MAG: hypothetical protein A3E01_06990 [Gammaproteobacteria bacterium RIFCSPHIGHO2_12_FULL_63_22]